MLPIVREKFNKYIEDLNIASKNLNDANHLIAGYLDCLKDYGFVTDDEMLELYCGVR